jgi:hypothetical protein
VCFGREELFSHGSVVVVQEGTMRPEQALKILLVMLGLLFMATV